MPLTLRRANLASAKGASCGRCRNALPDAPLWSIVSEFAPTEVLDAIEEGTLNVVTCDFCGASGPMHVPLVVLSWVRGFTLLHHNPAINTLTKEQTQRAILDLSDDRHFRTMIQERSVWVESALDLRDAWAMNAAQARRVVQAARSADARRGIYGADRVRLIIRDRAADDAIYLSEYERSRELLHDKVSWQVDGGSELRRSVVTDPEEVSPAASSRALKDIWEGVRSKVPDISAGIPAPKRDPLDLVAADPRFEARARALAAAQARPLHGSALAQAARQIIVALTARATTGPEPPSTDDDEAVRAEVREMVEHLTTEDGRIATTRLSWEDVWEEDLGDGYRDAVHALSEGRPAEAFERLATLVTDAEVVSPTIEVWLGIAAVEAGHPSGGSLIVSGMDGVARTAELTGVMSYEGLQGLAHGSRSLGRIALANRQLEMGVEHFLAAIDGFLTLGENSNVGLLGPEAVELLALIGRTEEAILLGRRLIERAEPVEHHAHSHAIALRRIMALTALPMFEGLVDLQTGSLFLSRRGAGSWEAPDQGTLYPKRDGLDRADPLADLVDGGIVLRLHHGSDSGEVGPGLIVGNAMYNELTLAGAAVADDDVHLAAQVQLGLTDVEDLADLGLSASIDRMGSLGTLMAQVAALEPDLHAANTLLALAARGTAIAVDVARHLDAVAAGQDVEADDLVTDQASSVWAIAAGLGEMSFELESFIGPRRGLSSEVLSDGGTTISSIVHYYPLALETLGQLDEAVDAYRRAIWHLEQSRSDAGLRDVALRAQGRMERPYARLSRVLFARYLHRPVSLADAIESAESLERHRARLLRRIVLDRLGEPAATSWLHQPLRWAVEALAGDEAVATVGLHSYTERIPGRWFVVGLTSPEDGWATECTPPEGLHVTSTWLRNRMSLVSSESVRSNVGDVGTFASVLDDTVPESELMEHLAQLWNFVRPDDPVRLLHLSVEDYALALPWLGSAIAARTDTQVSVGPSTALVRSGRGATWPTPWRCSVVTAAEEGWPETGATLAVRAGQIAGPAADLTYHDPGRPPLTAADADVVALVGHGHIERGLDTEIVGAIGDPPPPVVLLLGCWSGVVNQDQAHKEVEGVAMDLLTRGVRTVIATLWPIVIPAVEVFLGDLLLRLGHQEAPGEALIGSLASWRDRPDALSHPAFWAGFTLFGAT